MGEVGPEHHRGRGVRGSRPRSTPQRGGRSSHHHPRHPPAPRGSGSRVTPAVWTAPRREERLESARSRLPPPGQQQEGAPNFGASSRRPQPLTRARRSRPATPPAPSRVLRPPATPRAGAVTSNEAAAQETKSPCPPRRRLARLLPDKKVIGRRPPWGPAVGRSTGLTRAAPRPPLPELRSSGSKR